MNGLDPEHLEAELSRVVLYDVSDRMTRNHRRQGPPRPDGQAIDRIFIHHSGALGKPGIEGAINSVRFVVDHRDFPGPAYHYWVPCYPLRDDAGRLVVLRLAPDSERTWHTGGAANNRGVGVAIQGNTTSLPLTLAQRQGLDALIPWLATRLGLDMEERSTWLGWHSDARRHGAPRNKPGCPGKHAEEWIKSFLAET